MGGEPGAGCAERSGFGVDTEEPAADTESEDAYRSVAFWPVSESELDSVGEPNGQPMFG